MSGHTTDILTDLAEVALDAVTENELLKEIPILGTAVRIARATSDIRDRAFLNKIHAFFTHLPDFTGEQRRRLIEEGKKDKKRRAKFGDAVFCAIEQSDSIAKVEYIAVAFEAFLNEEMSDSDLRMICHAIRTTFIDELVDFVEREASPPAADLKYLEAPGLAYSRHKPLTVGGHTEPAYLISDAGTKLREAWEKYGKKA